MKQQATLKLILIPLLLLLASCTQYRYDVDITPCVQPKNASGLTMLWSFTYTGTTDPYIEWKDVYMKNINWKENNWADICNFSYTRNEIK
jgi:hypothetical protein